MANTRGSKTASKRWAGPGKSRASKKSKGRAKLSFINDAASANDESATSDTESVLEESNDRAKRTGSDGPGKPRQATHGLKPTITVKYCHTGLYDAHGSRRTTGTCPAQDPRLLTPRRSSPVSQVHSIGEETQGAGLIGLLANPGPLLVQDFTKGLELTPRPPVWSKIQPLCRAIAFSITAKPLCRAIAFSITARTGQAQKDRPYNPKQRGTWGSNFTSSNATDDGKEVDHSPTYNRNIPEVVKSLMLPYWKKFPGIQGRTICDLGGVTGNTRKTEQNTKPWCLAPSSIMSLCQTAVGNIESIDLDEFTLAAVASSDYLQEI
ncbi:hypothetical protein THAOC_18629 [Thalassiosira oceanica]|uniref:Uncharacterized protein n=1 Tax=Thalassiosira oceanica TaxID=159749 RepID=K0SIU9_THAOC|nr:hypothetical protein THAOC_18629 [Thalassiosira oceanica]|eukprot:EJK60951.1 hypothetical protein THAOC_18629 [Thalassiosira oceanica]